jgi:hypothetical protein
LEKSFDGDTTLAVAAGAIPVLPGLSNAATTEGGIIADPNFFDQLYKYGVFVAFGLAAVTYIALTRGDPGAVARRRGGGAMTSAAFTAF